MFNPLGNYLAALEYCLVIFSPSRCAVELALSRSLPASPARIPV